MKNNRALVTACCLCLGVSLHGAPANDDFTNSVELMGTNITYSGTVYGATLEPGEPTPGATNTVWMSWAAPTTGAAQVNLANAPQRQYWAVFTGPTVDHLQPVTTVPRYMNNLYRFIATEGTVYHFQFSGGATNFTFFLQFQPFGVCSNDNFAQAQQVTGSVVYFNPATVNGATMEVGEPQHIGPIPQQSIWWQWQSPQWGSCFLDPRASLATNYVLAVYTGNSVGALTPVAKGTNGYFSFQVNGGQTYAIAGAVPTNSIGDILNFLQLDSFDISEHVVPGNLLQEPSWEGTGILGAQYWHWSGQLGGYVNQTTGAVDGTTWPELNPGTAIWQDFPTVPGHAYAIKFAYLIGGPLSGGSGDAQVAVSWDTNQLGVSTIPGAEAGFWHWDHYVTVASNTTSRVTFLNVGRNVEMDAFSVVDATAAPAIVSQPASLSSVAGGEATFNVGATGTPLLCYQWLFNGAPLAGATNAQLVLAALTTNQVGNYSAVVTNSFGSVTSAVASLRVDAPADATILFQPYGGVVSLGGYFQFNVVASGTPPLSYQWYLSNQPIAGATNRTLVLNNVQSSNGGTYTVQVRNPGTLVWSLPATLTVSTSDIGGGTIDFRNNFVGQTNANVPVFDVDGLTALNGSNYRAQLYAGPSLALLRPAGQPSPFEEGFSAGYFVPQTITLANVAPGSNLVAQVRAWDSIFGDSYEAARALGGRFGKSQLLQVIAGAGTNTPAPLTGLQSFNLQAGLPYFQVGTVEFVGRQGPDTLVWAVHGQTNSFYLVEKSVDLGTTAWQPYTVVTNVTGTVTFTDTASSDAKIVLYRARILD